MAASNYPKIILSSGKDQSLRRFHPWVFSGAIKKHVPAKEPADGTVVEVFDNKDEYLGSGHFQKGSISVRILTFEREDIDQEFWNKRIALALAYRHSVGISDRSDTNAFRLVHAEGDGLPGLIIDFYNGTCVVQCHSIGMHLSREMICEALKKALGDRLQAVYDKSKETLPSGYASNVKNEYLIGKGSEEHHWVQENGLSFWVDWKLGQKTGFFLDQEANRRTLRSYSSNRTVMNAFSYTGGFSMYALAGNARQVHSVDSSKRAIDLLDKNVKKNFQDDRHESYCNDVFDFMKGKQDVFDLIILDPPAFAKHTNVRHNAVMGYKRLNAEAFKIIRPGGLLFTFSCSQVIDRTLFERTILSAAIIAGRKVRILHHLSQGPDHPVSIYHPEGEYLKGLVLYVE